MRALEGARTSTGDVMTSDGLATKVRVRPGLMALMLLASACVPPASTGDEEGADTAPLVEGGQDGGGPPVSTPDSGADDGGIDPADSAPRAEDGALPGARDLGTLDAAVTDATAGDATSVADGALGDADGGNTPDVDATPEREMGAPPIAVDAAAEPDDAIPVDARPPDWGPPRPPGENLETEILTTPPALTNREMAVFTYRSNDGRARFECQIDGGDWIRCRSGQAFGPLRDGRHTFTVVAIDPDGVLDRVPPSYEWTIDTTPPTIRLDGLGQFGDLSGCGPQSGLSVRFSSNERDSTFRCQSTISYAGGLEEEMRTEACTSPYELTYSCIDDRPVGALVRVWSRDPAGNESARFVEAPGRVYRCPDCN